MRKINKGAVRQLLKFASSADSNRCALSAEHHEPLLLQQYSFEGAGATVQL
jgi:hypothetical protein